MGNPARLVRTRIGEYARSLAAASARSPCAAARDKWAIVRDENKKQGIIIDYAIYQGRPRDPQDADLILTVTYKNMAAFDDLQARTDPTAKQAFGSLAKAASASADRSKLRIEVGSQMVRQLILK